MIPLEDIRAAQETLAGTAIRTPLVRLHAGDGAEIYLKLENLQPIGSFKIRGARTLRGGLGPRRSPR
ncbi:MAG: pyridoxal-phosphate dependent enzyme [Gaiellaceae bacterium]